MNNTWKYTCPKFTVALESKYDVYTFCLLLRGRHE